MIKSEMLCKFRRIARSRTEKNAIDDLRNCEQWKSGYTSMVNWFRKAMDATYRNKLYFSKFYILITF